MDNEELNLLKEKLQKAINEKFSGSNRDRIVLTDLCNVYPVWDLSNDTLSKFEVLVDKSRKEIIEIMKNEL
jgi:hypothetical protein